MGVRRSDPGRVEESPQRGVVRRGRQEQHLQRRRGGEVDVEERLAGRRQIAALQRVVEAAPEASGVETHRLGNGRAARVLDVGPDLLRHLVERLHGRGVSGVVPLERGDAV